MPENSTIADVFATLEGRRAEEAPRLDALFREATGFEPRVWTGGIIGYGRFDYAYKSGRTGTCYASGFAARKAKLTIYIMPGYTDFSDILGRLGKHKMGKACLYLNKLADADPDVLAELIRAGLKDLAEAWPVFPE